MPVNSNEIFPIVDPRGNTIGKATRGECHNGSKILHPVVHLQLFNSRGEVHEASAFAVGASMLTSHAINWNDTSVRKGQKVHGIHSAVQPYVAVYIWRRTA